MRCDGGVAFVQEFIQIDWYHSPGASYSLDSPSRMELAAVQKNFSRNLDELENIFRFIRTCMQTYDIAEFNDFSLKFIVEELFTNMVKYSKPSGSDISIQLDRDGNQCRIVLEEKDVDRFDPTHLPDPDVARSLEARTPGGLGVFLVKRMADSMAYHYENRCATITVTKQLEERHV
jgi:serine/threonine-protein kinase RsbW